MSNITTIKECCASNGPGLRTAIWLAGCPGVWRLPDGTMTHCPGCFNQSAWDPNVGHELTDTGIDDILSTIDSPHVQGLSILGGEPLALYNQSTTRRIIEKLRERFGDNKDIWIWTGYVIGDTLPVTDDARWIIKNVDAIIAGPFVQALFHDGLVNMGSTNQRELHREELQKIEL